MTIFNQVLSISLIILWWNPRIESYNIKNTIKIDTEKQTKFVDGVFEKDDRGNRKNFAYIKHIHSCVPTSVLLYPS